MVPAEGPARAANQGANKKSIFGCEKAVRADTGNGSNAAAMKAEAAIERWCDESGDEAYEAGDAASDMYG